MLPSLRSAAGEANVTEREWVTGAEDFSYVLQRMPGCMMFLGVMPESHREHDHVAPCHSNRMMLNEDCMAAGIAMHASIAHRFLAQDGTG